MFSQTGNFESEALETIAIESVIKLAADINPNELVPRFVADSAKQEHRAISRYFPTAESIFKPVVEWITDMLLARIHYATKSSLSPLDAIEAMFHTNIDFVNAHPGAPRIIFSLLQSCTMSPHIQMISALIELYKCRIQAQLEIAKVNGDVRENLDSEAAATLLIRTMQGLVIQSIVIDKTKLNRSEASKIFKSFRRGIEVCHD